MYHVTVNFLHFGAFRVWSDGKDIKRDGIWVQLYEIDFSNRFYPMALSYDI
jgi:hypothetical protein